MEKPYDEVQSTRQDFLIVQAAVMPTNVFPAPHGSTMIPDRARLATRWLACRGVAGRKPLPIPKHLTQTGFLVRSDDGGWLKVDV